MHDRSYALFTAAFLFALTLALVVVAVWLTGADTQRRPYELVTSDRVSGLSDTSQVYYRGVPVGRVHQLDIEPDGRIRIGIRVDPEVPITHGTHAVLESRGLTGVASVQLDDTGDDPRALRTDADQPAEIPLRLGLLDRLADSGETVFENLETLTSRIERLLSDDNLERVDSILANVDTAGEKFIELQDQAAASLESIPPLADDLRQSLARIDAVTGDLATFTPRLHEVADEFTSVAREFSGAARDGRRIGQQVEQALLPRLDQTLERMNATVADFSRLSRQLEQHPESLIRGRQPPRPGPGERGYQEERQE